MRGGGAGGIASPQALYVIEMGSNDVRDALTAVGGPQPVLTSALIAIRTNVMTLYAAGARKFLIWNVPNPALTPAIRALNSPQASAGATLVAMAFNQGLDGEILFLRTTLPGIDIVKLDVYQLLNAAVAMWIVGRTATIQEGLAPARELLLGGAVRKKIADTREFFRS